MVSELSKNILGGIALALGGSPYEFEGDRAGDAFWACRIMVTQEQFCRTACPTNHPKMKLDGIIENTQPFLCFLSYF